MNWKIVSAFVAGAVIASGIVYMAVKPGPLAKPMTVVVRPQPQARAAFADSGAVSDRGNAGCGALGIEAGAGPGACSRKAVTDAPASAEGEAGLGGSQPGTLARTRAKTGGGSEAAGTSSPGG